MFLDQNGERQHVHQVSFGMSTRMIGTNLSSADGANACAIQSFMQILLLMDTLR